MNASVAPRSDRTERSLGYRVRRTAGHVAFGLTVLVIISPALLVFLWMLSLAFKNEVDNAAYPPVFIPNPPILGNFTVAFERNNFGQYTINSLVVSGSTTLVSLLVGVPAAYGLAKAKAQGVALLVMISRMTPGLSYLIPLYMLFRFVGLGGQDWTMGISRQAITHLVIGLPIVVWVMIGFFEDLHPELEEAALTDGCDLWQAFYKVAMPLSLPGMVVSGILAFIFSWNNFLFGVVLAGQNTRTLPVAVINSLTFEQISWGPLAAAALIVTLPALILTILVQRHIVTGLTSGAVKGG